MVRISTSIPLVDLKSQYLALKPEIDEAISRFLHSGSYVMGAEVGLFEKEWAEYCGAKYCIGVSSGTDALYLALMVTCTKSQVITTPLTFFATSQAIIHSGNYPAFIDVDESGNLPAYNFGSKVVVPVDLYGRPGDWKGTNLIVDSAQSHGAPFRGRMACYSFYPTKNLGAFGQAGAIITDDPWLNHAIREYRTYGERERFVHYARTGNFRMDELQAAILRVKLPYLRAWNDARRTIARIYGDYLKGLEGVITLPEDHPGHVYHAYVIRCKDRDNLADYLKKNGVQTSPRYPVPMHLQPALKYLGYSKGDFPVAEEWARTNLNLPMYPELTGEQIRYICDRIKEWAERKDNEDRHS